jgi:hypothetical protein
MHRWAEEKLISDSIIYPLIDCAKSKGAYDRVDSYWRTWWCLRRVTTDSSTGKLHGKYCRTRPCAICCGIRKASKIIAYSSTVRSWENPFTLVVSLKSPAAKNLNKVIDEMFALLNRIIEKYKQRKRRGKGFKLVGIRSLECTYNPKDNTYHPHFHFILQNKEMAIALQDEWMREGRKRWGKQAINQAGQYCEPIRKNELDGKMRDAIKYTTKIFTKIDPKQKGKKGERKIYIDALDNILAAMSRRRIFDRFGFNLPKQENEKFLPRKLKYFKEWEYLPDCSDWHEKEGVLTLTGYVAEENLKELLTNSIVKAK